MNWYKKAQEEELMKEAGLKENIVTLALATLFMLPIDIMAFKHIKNIKPNTPTELIVDNLKQAKEIKKNVETGKYTPEEKIVYDQAQVLKEEIKQPPKANISLDDIVKIMLQHENLAPKQTPFRITNETMKNWNTIQGFEIDKVNPSYQERVKSRRQNFIFLKNPNDVYPAVVKQIKAYIANPAKYKLPQNFTIKDMIYKFDQSNASGKIDFIKKNMPNINLDAPMSSLVQPTQMASLE